jgi:hypothetical protein
VAKSDAELTLASVARHMRRSMDSNACVANEQSQKDNKANVAGGGVHVCV